ncbi:SurA N-terminal domain-containing protein [Celerinatantimonas sp. MCCC 1A17872]|uniref:SurA N-terminal domain-containing protein n=1 Tax=Celerinatantimonas sp. MCCC 1A17872 TaxID=3177514 RepID=UPI0038BE6047
MLEKIQEGGQGLIIKIILCLIIISFALAGIGSYLGSSGGSYAAKVNGETISEAEFQQAYQQQRSQMQQRYGSAFSQLADNPQYIAQLKQGVLARLVNQKLIDQESEKLGIAVSDKQVEDNIKNMDAFKQNGKFDNALFLQRLQSNGLTAVRFSQLIRTDMQNTQLQQALFESQFVLNNEVKQLGNLQAQTRSFHYVHVPEENFAGTIKVSDKEVKAYYQQHQEQFRSPETVDINYILLDAKSIANSINVTDEQAKQYFHEHADQYQLPVQRHVAHILIKPGKDPQKAQAEAEKLEKELKNGADFATLAKKYSQDQFSAKKGGDLDWFQKGVMPKAFDKAAFGLAKVGDISGVVKTKYGYHIIKLLGVQDSKLPPFARVKDKIVKKVQQDQAMTKFYDVSQKLNNLTYESPDSLDETAKKLGLKLETAKGVSRDNLPKDIDSQQAIEQIFSKDAIEKQQNSPIINLSPEQALVVRVTGHKAASVKPFDKVKEDAKQALVTEKAIQQAQDYANKLASVADKSAEFDKLLQAQNLKLQRASDVARNDQKLDQQVVSEAFTMAHPKDGKHPAKAIKTATGDAFVITLDQINQPKVDDNLKQQILKQWPSQLANEDYRLLLDYLKSKADISYNG